MKNKKIATDPKRYIHESLIANGCDDRFSARTLSGAGKNLASQDGWISNWFRAREVSRGSKLFEARWRGRPPRKMSHPPSFLPPIILHFSSIFLELFLDPRRPSTFLAHRNINIPSIFKNFIIFHHPLFNFAPSLSFVRVSKSLNAIIF